jgi:phospholipid-binding lipoprotein MlaA
MKNPAMRTTDAPSRRATFPCLAWLALSGALALALAGCAGSAARGAQPHPGAYDPLEPINRKVFWFNDKFDQYLLKPAATGWDWLLPGAVERSVRNFFDNLRFPVRATNDLLQAKLEHAAVDVGRFAVNTTVGAAGFFDPATTWGLQRNDEDLGQTLGYYGCPSGPYLVLPIFGPSNPRDAVGLVGDSFIAVYPIFVPFVYTFTAAAVDTVNSRALALTAVQEAKTASLDFYSAVRDAYAQRRQRLINDGGGISPGNENELYFPEEGQPGGAPGVVVPPGGDSGGDTGQGGEAR